MSPYKVLPMSYYTSPRTPGGKQEGALSLGNRSRITHPSTNSPSDKGFVQSSELVEIHSAPYFQGFHDFFTLQILRPRNVHQNALQRKRERALARRKFPHDIAHPALAHLRDLLAYAHARPKSITVTSIYPVYV